MTFSIEAPTTISEETFDRLFSEAYNYISIERQRVGELLLKERMWGIMNNPEGNCITRAYKIDDYIVGCSVIQGISINNIQYMWYIQPTYGTDQNGSKAWWYSEDFLRVGKEWMIENGFDKILVIHNPSSPAASAVLNHFGTSFNGVSYFSTPQVYEINEFFGPENPENPRTNIDGMKVFVIDII